MATKPNESCSCSSLKQWMPYAGQWSWKEHDSNNPIRPAILALKALQEKCVRLSTESSSRSDARYLLNAAQQFAKASDSLGRIKPKLLDLLLKP